MLEKPERRIRSKFYLTWAKGEVRPCALCRAPATDLHHVGDHGMGRKASDFQVVPLCKTCHMGVHDLGLEWLGVKYGKTAAQVELALWQGVLFLQSDFITDRLPGAVAPLQAGALKRLRYARVAKTVMDLIPRFKGLAEWLAREIPNRLNDSDPNRQGFLDS